jgi:hypothetical protein
VGADEVDPRARRMGFFVVFSDGSAVGHLAGRRFERSVGPAGSGSAAHRGTGSWASRARRRAESPRPSESDLRPASVPGRARRW